MEQRISGFQSFNFFIGANNSGKSIVLNFLAHHLLQAKGSLDGNSVEIYRGQTTGEMVYEVGIPKDKFLAAVLSQIDLQHLHSRGDAVLEQIVDNLSPEDDHIWVRREKGQLGRFWYADTTNVVDVHDQRTWRWISNTLTQMQGGSIEHWVSHTLERLLRPQTLTLPEIRLIPAKRVIGPRDEKFEDLSGRGLIDRLAEIQSPDHHTYARDREQFAKINRFLQSVTDRADARIEIPHNRSAILVHMDNKVLPLESLGTGIHEVVMIAAFSTINENCIMCIEEPEIHLHPILQRKLVRYLQENTNNQYFIATHSAAFIDTPGAAIYHVSNDGSQTYIRGTQLRSEKYRVSPIWDTRLPTSCNQMLLFG